MDLNPRTRYFCTVLPLPTKSVYVELFFCLKLYVELCYIRRLGFQQSSQMEKWITEVKNRYGGMATFNIWKGRNEGTETNHRNNMRYKTVVRARNCCKHLHIGRTTQTEVRRIACSCFLTEFSARTMPDVFATNKISAGNMVYTAVVRQRNYFARL